MKRSWFALPLLLLLPWFLSACGSRNTPVSFLRHWIIDPDPNTGKRCCTDIAILGDINGDGNLDVVIGAEHADGAGLVWYQYPTWEKHPIADGEFTTDGQAADIDGDGDLDIAIGTFPEGGGEILWFEHGTGTGAGEWIRHHVGNRYAHDLVVGDVDGDGSVDMVTCDKENVSVWRQLSPDSWREVVVAKRTGEGIALADLDEDGDLDIVYGGSWLKNSGSWNGTPWASHPIAPKWSSETRVFVADMNGDGRPDVVLSVSEGKGSLSWFESPENPEMGVWAEHPIEERMLEEAHTLQVADMDGDGKPDVITAEMHTSREKRVLIYLNREGGTFQPVVVARTGSHNMRAGDIDNDGDVDIVGKNYAGPGRFFPIWKKLVGERTAGPGRVIEMWENLTVNDIPWRYISIDGNRPKGQREKMGLCFTDANRDGFPDVAAGSFLYLNPLGKIGERWERIPLPEEIDVFFSVDVNANDRNDLIGIAGDTVFWLEAEDETGDLWNARPVGKVANGRTQGYVAARLLPGNAPQMVFTRGKNLYVLEIPTDPERNAWPLHLVSTENEEEGIAAGDIDGDGDLDIVAVGADGHRLIWLENPGSLSVPWKARFVGDQISKSQAWLDRVALADLNGDGRLDVLATEERQDWKRIAHLYWFEAPVDPGKGRWVRRIVGRFRSLNSMDVADVDGDGQIDIAVAEHTDQGEDGAEDNLTVLFLNRNQGSRWVPHVVERGPHSSHLGARLADLNRDGFPEIVSIGWGQYRHVHVWEKVIPGFAALKRNLN